MRKIVALFILLTLSVRSFAEAPRDCAIEGKSWDSLLQEFIGGWHADGEFCEFKRFTTLNAMISEDMRSNAVEYELRLKALESFNDESEPVNYLLTAFQETWFNLFIDASLDREYDKASGYWVTAGVSAGGLATLALASSYTKTFSTKATRFLRGFIINYFKKRAVVFGGTSFGQGIKKIELGKKPDVETGYVRPPLFNSAGTSIDPRTSGVFVGEFWDQMIAAGAGVAGGWAGGHYVSIGVKGLVPKWASVIRFGWAKGRIADFASPGVIAGAAVTYYMTEKIAEGVSRFEFKRRVDTAKDGLMAIAAKVTASAAAENEYAVWLAGEQLKNGLMLQNYLLTRDFTQSLGNEAESFTRVTLNLFSDCERERAVTLTAQKAAFKKRVEELVQSERLNLLAALDITQRVQDALLANAGPMTDPLIDANNSLILRDQWILNPGPLSDEWWTDIEAAVKDVKVECVQPAPPWIYQ